MDQIEIPKDLADLFRKPDEIIAAFKFVYAVQHFGVKCDGNQVPLKEADENAVVDITDIVPRFSLPPQSFAFSSQELSNRGTGGMFLMSNGEDGTESWVDPSTL